jgi:hypothetical protein
MHGKLDIRHVGAWLITTLAFCAPAMAGDTPAAPAHAATTETTPSDADLAQTVCVPSEEHILPGDFFYCIAERSYGHGDVAESQRFFKEAASWASKPAQYVLGVMALNGDHQPVNRPLGIAWLALASERPNSSFKEAYEAALQSATPSERERSQSLLKDMLPTYGDTVAAPRAERRYADGMARFNHAAARGDGISCMAGEQNLGADPHKNAHCMASQKMSMALDKAAANVFDGWSGHVTVGDLSTVDHH